MRHLFYQWAQHRRLRMARYGAGTKEILSLNDRQQNMCVRIKIVSVCLQRYSLCNKNIALTPNPNVYHGASMCVSIYRSFSAFPYYTKLTQ